jgi:replicative DNA helicase
MDLHIPPHSVEAERGILGSILLDKDAIIQIASLLVPADFYDPANGIVFEAMLELYSRNRPIDILTVRENLDDKKKLE